MGQCTNGAGPVRHIGSSLVKVNSRNESGEEDQKDTQHANSAKRGRPSARMNYHEVSGYFLDASTDGIRCGKLLLVRDDQEQERRDQFDLPLQTRKCPFRGSNSLIHIIFRVRHGKECCLKLRGWQVDS